MARRRKRQRKEIVKCLLEWCWKDATTAGLCRRHYNWDYYHSVRGHGLTYWHAYKAEREELLRRASVKLRPALRKVG